MKKVFVTRLLPEGAMERLAEFAEVSANREDRVLGAEEIREGIRDADALLCLLTDRIDAETLDANPSLKIIANYAVGFNNIDLDAATERGIPVTNTPGVLTETTADFAWTLMMAVARRVVEGDSMMRAGTFRGWGPTLLLGSDVHGKTLGVVGMGAIGAAVARRAVGFRMRVLYHDERPLHPVAEDLLAARRVDLDTLLAESDFVSAHVPLLPETRHLFGEAAFRKMKRTAYFVNTSRGPVVDEAALVDALRTGEIAGAGLDVFEREPEMHPGLADLPNAVLAPHIASASLETRTAMGLLAVENIRARFESRPLPTLLNPEALEGRPVPRAT